MSFCEYSVSPHNDRDSVERRVAVWQLCASAEALILTNEVSTVHQAALYQEFTLNRNVHPDVHSKIVNQCSRVCHCKISHSLLITQKPYLVIILTDCRDF